MKDFTSRKNELITNDMRTNENATNGISYVVNLM